ncbi:ABC transporter ATP-binding protein [Bradyrhizobium sp.]|uniref:ABC transporter ATP-binding protein n=1 Tax=Bradyrhizobium sp. TaxID=376 RepID=UPI0039E68607
MKQYDSFVAVREMSLEVGDGEFLALLGPSGCGKTTTLRMIAGFVEASAGRIFFGNEDVTDLPPNKRNTGMVFQGFALFPHMTVAQNVAYGLEMRRIAKPDIKTRVAKVLDLVQLGRFSERLPRQLSGGQQQRVALARALVINPHVLLLDEPLSALDAKLRHDVRTQIRQLQQSLGLTTVFVTHDQEEALSLADRLVVMNGGAIEQVGTPADLYERPATPFVADFIGKTNFFNGELSGDRFVFGDGDAWLKVLPRIPGANLLGIRPEKVGLSPSNAPASRSAAVNEMSGTVELVSYLGPTTEYRVRVAGEKHILVQRPNGDTTEPVNIGQNVTLRIPMECCFLFEADKRAQEFSGAKT